MNPHERLATEVTAWGPGVVDHLWQSTLFALLLFVVSMLVRRGPASLRHSLWLLALAKFLVPTAVVVFLTQQAGIDAADFFRAGSETQASFLQGLTQPLTSIVYEVTVVATATVRHNEVYCALVAISLTGTTAFLVIWAKQRRKFFRSLSRGRRADHGREWQALERAKELLRWKPGVALIITPDNTEPAVCRVWKPVILLPQAIANHLDDDELEAIMLHELVHIRRRDNLVGNLQMALCALLWFHPLVWLISSKLFDERELACDEEVLKMRAAPETYAAGILKVVRFSMGWRVAGVTGAGNGSNLRRRIENIMTSNNRKHSRAVWHRLFAGTLAGFAIVAALVAGFHTRARAVSVVATQSVPAVEVNSVTESIEQIDQVDREQDKSKTVQPPQPPQVAQPSQPPQPPQPAQAAQPSQPAQAAQPPQEPSSVAAAPVPPTPATTGSPFSPPAPPAKEKSKDKDKEKDDKVKQKGEKRNVEKGDLIDAPQPVYPTEARERKIQGKVSVAIVIGEDGNVVSAKPTSGPDALHDAAREAAFKARFQPSKVDGKPVKVSGALSYNFVIDEK
ncbi:MAG TPA: M56 family metallopeptidase [Pyrinomonadaceae bacterium]|nr:M56 family metallopeptidase [Pyrinomonadaceae bacterium]